MSTKMREAQSRAASPARRHVYQFVRDAILRGEFIPGEFIEEETICRATGLSRTPVREAFHRLDSERFLELMPRRGARVRGVTPREMLELYETRRLIEGFAIDRRCEREVAANDLASLAQQMREVGSEDPLTHVELDRLFHRALVAAMGNQILVEVYDGFRSRQQRVAMAALQADPSRLALILFEHDALVAALRVGDAASARAVLDQHLQPMDHVLLQLNGSSPQA